MTCNAFISDFIIRKEEVWCFNRLLFSGCSCYVLSHARCVAEFYTVIQHVACMSIQQWHDC